MSFAAQNAQLATFDKFSAVFCSGFFVDNPHLLTALCLVFDQVHVLNPMSFVSEHAMHHPSPFATGPEPFDTDKVKIRLNNEWVPLSLPPGQLEAMTNYMLLTKRFWIANALLHGKILQSDLFVGQDLSTQYSDINPDVLYDLKRLGEIDFRVLTSNTGTERLIADLLDRGAAPVFGGGSVTDQHAVAPTTTYGIASVLAIQAATMALPGMRAAHPEVILEARERLRDHLPAFWAYMLRLSGDFRVHIREGMPLQEAERECKNFIDAQITPVLLDTRRKMTMEYASWFHKIITPVSDGVELAVGKPNLSWANLLAILLKTSGSIFTNLTSDDARRIDAGLAFLIKLHDVGTSRGG